jgi:hypothetical protein
MHCERRSYVLQNRELALQIPACGERAEHKLLGDIPRRCVVGLDVYVVMTPQTILAAIDFLLTGF